MPHHNEIEPKLLLCNNLPIILAVLFSFLFFVFPSTFPECKVPKPSPTSMLLWSGRPASSSISPRPPPPSLHSRNDFCQAICDHVITRQPLHQPAVAAGSDLRWRVSFPEEQGTSWGGWRGSVACRYLAAAGAPIRFTAGVYTRRAVMQNANVRMILGGVFVFLLSWQHSGPFCLPNIKMC